MKNLYFIMSKFNKLINDPLIQSLTVEQVNLMIFMDLASDPKRLTEYENKLYDPDYMEEEEELDKPVERVGVSQDCIITDSSGVIQSEDDSVEDDDFDEEFAKL